MSKLDTYVDVTAKQDADLGSDTTTKEEFEEIMDSRFGGTDMAHQLLIHVIKRRNNLNPTRLTSDAIRDDYQTTLRNVIIMMNEESGRRRTWPTFSQEAQMKANILQLHREMKKSGVIITKTGFRYPKVEDEVKLED